MPDASVPMDVLCVLTSSNQLYSGIGRALFEPAHRMAPSVRYTFAIDDRHARNVAILEAFGREHGFRVEVGRARDVADTLDPVSADVPALLRGRSWDLVECVCWADAATHGVVLEHIGSRPLVYTPHHQPSWTVAMTAEVQDRVESVHRAMLRRADLTLCDSPWEQAELRAREPAGGRFAFLPLGCDVAEEPPHGIPRREQLLFVGDLAEPRKRFDRVLAILARLVRDRPSLRLVAIGNRSEEALGRVPEWLRAHVELRGYVGERELRAAYAESLALVLLSEYEAFGIPILEALAAGTPVFLSQQPTTRSLFGPYRGAHFCPAEDEAATTAIVRDVLAHHEEALALAAEDLPRLRATFDWTVLADRKRALMAAAWSRRHLFAIPA